MSSSSLSTFSSFHTNFRELVSMLDDGYDLSYIPTSEALSSRFSSLRESMVQLYDVLSRHKSEIANLDLNNMIANVWETLTPHRNILDELERFINSLSNKNLEGMITQTRESLTSHRSSLNELENLLNNLYRYLETRQSG
jgi:methyl-accepting chemotaxis protein